MYKRPKIYYPKTKIITNLYTRGKEWMFENGVEYIGYYHRYLDGLVLTEPYYNMVKSEKIIPYSEIKRNQPNVIYDSISDLQVSFNASPTNVYTLPTLDDYKKGFFKRYFVYRRNLKDIYKEFFEVNDTQYKSWKTPRVGIDEILYNAFVIEWRLTGPLNDIMANGQIIEFGVHDTNKRLVYLNEKQFPGIIKILTDYKEFSIHSLLTPEEIRKQFGNM
jgi:hypothetical protein